MAAPANASNVFPLKRRIDFALWFDPCRTSTSVSGRPDEVGKTTVYVRSRPSTGTCPISDPINWSRVEGRFVFRIIQNLFRDWG